MKLDGIQGLIFDLGGTLYRPAMDLCGQTRLFLAQIADTQDGSFPNRVILDAMIDPDQWLDDYMISNDVGPHWQPTKEVWLEYDRLLLRNLGVSQDIENIAERYQAAWDRYMSTIKPELMKGCIEEFVRLQERGIKLAVASNRYGSPEQVLKDDGIIDFFEAVEYSRVPGYCKPSPYMLFKVADAFGLNPRRCAYVGNIVKYDVIAAKNAGMIPILLAWCDPQEKDKITEDTIVIEHIQELGEILG